MVAADPANGAALDSVSRSRLAFTCSRTWTPLGRIFKSLEAVASKLAPLSRSFFGPPADNPFSSADSAFLAPTNFGFRVLICLIEGIDEDSRSSSCRGELSPATDGERSVSSSSIIARTAPEIAARPKRSEALSANTCKGAGRSANRTMTTLNLRLKLTPKNGLRSPLSRRGTIQQDITDRVLFQSSIDP